MTDSETIARSLASLENRIARIERHLSLSSPPPVHSDSTAHSESLSGTAMTTETPATIRHDYQRPSTQSSRDEDSQRTGGNFLGAVAVICFVLAASYLVKLAIDTGWLTPLRQLGAASLFGFSLIGSGYMLQQRDAPYSSYLPGAGVIILFLCAYAGHLHFNIYNADTAMVVTGFVSLLSVYLFFVFRQAVFVLAPVVGTYCIPLLVAGGYSALQDLSWYFVFWDVTFIILAILLQNRRVIALTSYFAIGVFFLLTIEHGHSQAAKEFSLIFQTIQFLLLAAGVTLYSIIRQTALTKTESWIFFPPLLFFYITQYPHLDAVNSHIAPWLALGFAAVLCALYWMAKIALPGKELQSGGLVASFSAVVFFHAGYLVLLPDSACPWLAVVLFAALGLMRDQLKEAWIARLCLQAIVCIEFLRSLSFLADVHIQSNILINALFAVCLFVAYGTAPKQNNEPGSSLLLLLASLQTLVGLHALALSVASSQSQPYVTSGLWAVYAIAMIIAGHARKDRVLARSSLPIFGLVSIKVLFWDIASTGSLVRVISLIVIGALLYAGGMLIRATESWQEHQS